MSWQPITAAFDEMESRRAVIFEQMRHRGLERARALAPVVLVQPEPHELQMRSVRREDIEVFQAVCSCGVAFKPSYSHDRARRSWAHHRTRHRSLRE